MCKHNLINNQLRSHIIRHKQLEKVSLMWWPVILGLREIWQGLCFGPLTKQRMDFGLKVY